MPRSRPVIDPPVLPSLIGGGRLGKTVSRSSVPTPITQIEARERQMTRARLARPGLIRRGA